MKISLVSLDQIWQDKKANLDVCEKYIQKASEHKVDLIIFPEMTLTGFSNNTGLTSEDFENSETINCFSILAKKFHIAIVFGIVVRNIEKSLNKSIFLDKSGKFLGDYSKIYPFSFAGEDRYFDAGSKLSVVDFEQTNFGLTICYDLRFPELYSALSKNSDIIINIANWPSKRVEHWETLLKARAIENQVFIIGVNRIGLDGNNLQYVESSNVFDANGDKVESRDIGNMRIYDIDKKWTKNFRSYFNTINDRKLWLYKEVL